MTNEEAIKHLNPNNIYADDNNIYTGDWEEAVLMAIEALEKQIPKKPTIDEHDDGTYSYICPCGAEVEENQVYCDICGQALDWENSTFD